MSSNRQEAWVAAALLLLLVVAAGLRLMGIEQRPLHHDEAINSIQLELLWHRGEYVYSPHALHGPTLPYLSLPFVWAGPAESYSDTRELTYRALPLVFGLALVLLTFGLAPGIGRGAALAAAALCAGSPAMVFYSRYYIHELLLVVFGLVGIACGWQALRRLGSGRPAWGWALGTGVAVGLMHATKETFVIALAAAGLGLAVSVPWRLPARILWWHALAVSAAAAAVSILFFSSFFDNLQGPLDSLASFSSYLQQGTSAGSVHDHPWYWYSTLLVFQERGGVAFSSEAAIAVLAVVGIVAAVRGRGLDASSVRLTRFFAVYTVAMLTVYSAIPYKTPWCMLGVLHGMIVLGGVGVVALLRAARSLPARVAVTALLLGVVVQLAFQNQLVNFRYDSDERNPWVYAHALSDVRRLPDVVKRIARLSSADRPISLHVYNWTDNASLYFYLRRIRNVRFHTAAEIAQASPSMDMILTDEAQRGELGESLEESHHVERFQLRPNIWGRLYVRQMLWDEAAGDFP